MVRLLFIYAAEKLLQYLANKLQPSKLLVSDLNALTDFVQYAEKHSFHRNDELNIRGTEL